MKICALLLSLLLSLLGCPTWAEDGIVTGPDRRHEIDLRLEALDAERAEISTKGPKAATAVGLGLALAGGIAFGVGTAACGEPREDSGGGCGGQWSATFARGAGMALLAIGGGVTIAGGVLWGRSIARRDEIDAERESLMKERDGLVAALSRVELQSAYRDDTHFVTLGLRF